MNVRKLTSWLLLLLIVLGALGGIQLLIGSNNGGNPEYTDVQSFAEYVAKLYITVDQNAQQRKEQLQIIAPSLAEVVSNSQETQQWVQHARAGEVDNYAANRYTVSVETWAVAKKIEKQNKKPESNNSNSSNSIAVSDAKKEKGPHFIPRRYKMDFDITGEPSTGFMVTGFPKIREVPLESKELPVIENAIDEKIILPVIEATFPSIFKGGDLDSISNYFTDDASIVPFPGGYKFQKVLSTQIYKAGKKEYRVLVFVKVQDPLTDVSFGQKVTTDMVEKNGKYYLQNVY